MMIEEALKIDNKQWTATYSWKRNPCDLPNNYSAACAMLRSTERRLLKNKGHADMYKEQIKDMVSRGVARKLSKEEIQNYDGPIFYIGHHEVMKPDSASTPCRIVFNSSAKFSNHILNDYWVKGPDLMNNLAGILMRFREEKVGITGDIRKMYHTIKTSVLDQHTHRFLWRDLQECRRPDVYVITSVSFGDKPAGAIAMLALQNTAKAGKDEHPKAAETILKNSYVDDIVDSCKNIKEASKLTSDIDVILGNGGFTIKKWTISGDKNHAAGSQFINDSQSRVLGIIWNPGTDKFEFSVRLNFSEKKRKLRSEPDLLAEEIPSAIPTNLTKRMILSQVNGIYDPLGLATPFTVRAKMLLRQLNMNEEVKLGWDDPIPDEYHQDWVNFFIELFQMKQITFSRTIKPVGTIGKPVLVIFSDASEHAYGACAYIRWELKGLQANIKESSGTHKENYHCKTRTKCCING